MRLLFLLLFSLSALASDPEKFHELESYLKQERPAFEERKKMRLDLLGDLDRLNNEQNATRKRIDGISQNHTELTMALENLALEQKKQKELEARQKERFASVLKVVHKVKREGVLRFLVNGNDLTQLTSRVRILLHLMRAQGSLAKWAEERTRRLAESEERIGLARRQSQALWEDLLDEEVLLRNVLKKKKTLLQRITASQNYYEAAARDYEKASREMKRLFKKLEAKRPTPIERRLSSRRGSLVVPVAAGKVMRFFGRHVHEKFQTVTYHNGIEIEAPHNSPVLAVSSGTVEFEGWIKGLGNVVIIDHGGGLYSLSAHLYEANAKVGDLIKSGDTIGKVGDTGNTEAPSLYLELRENGKAVDPVLYFSPDSRSNLT